MLTQFDKHIANQFSFLDEKKLLIAISGGVDSVVLTHLLKQLNFDISLAHCNFNLRKRESNKDEEFVKELGKKLQLETFNTQFNTQKYSKEKKISTQIAARELRYRWFQKLAVKHNFDYVLTAHHLDDNLETFLINLTRGTGLEGLTGIPAINKNIVRPLLIFSRKEIKHYAKNNNILWREDKSNASTKYIRNKIRHQILPILKEINPNLLNSFQKTTEHLQESQQIIDAAIINLKKKTIITDKKGVLKFRISEILKLPNPKAYLFELLKAYHFTKWNDVTDLLTAQSGKQIFSKTHRLLKDRTFLLLTEIKLGNKSSAFLIQKNITKIKTPIQLKLERTTSIAIQENSTIYLDLDKISFPLILRRWKEGDYFYPVGMQGKKKLSKFFKDEKYSLIDKENTWLLCSENQIIWIVEKRQDKRFITTKDSTNTLKMEMIH